MRVTFWGTRGSIPAPMNAEEFRRKARRLIAGAASVDLADPGALNDYMDGAGCDAATFGGNTPCVEVTGENSRLILDCGSGLRELGSRIMEDDSAPRRIDILQTHTHWDHIMGFPFFGPALSGGYDIHIHGVHPGLRGRFASQMDRVHFPITLEDLRSDVTFHQLRSGEEIMLGPFRIGNRGLHHPGGSHAYRVTLGGRSMVFATDGEYPDRSDSALAPYAEFCRDADLLVFDAMYATLEETIERQHYGHSTAVIGVDIALRAGVKNLALFHHAPESDDRRIVQSLDRAREYHASIRERFSGHGLRILAAYDGQAVEV